MNLLFYLNHFHDFISTSHFKSPTAFVNIYFLTYLELTLMYLKKCKFFFLNSGPNDFEGDPVQVGIITCIQGVQEFTLPDNLPMEAKSVRIIPVPVLQAGLPAATQAFVKIWTEYTGVDFINVKRTNVVSAAFTTYM